MKKHLIAVLLTACLLFSFGTTAFADSSGGQESNKDGANISVTQNEETYTITYVDGVGSTFRTKTYNNSEKATVIEDIPTREDYIFDKWKDEKNEKSYKKGNKLPQESITLTAQWVLDQRHFGYYLSDPNAKWENDVYPNGVQRYTDGDKTKYRETRIVNREGTTTVTDKIPVLDGYIFLGWGDKQRGDQQPAAIRVKGNTLTYCYDNDYYTLDALWGRLTAVGDKKVYDGKRIELNPAELTTSKAGLIEKLSDTYYNLLSKSEIMYSADNANWTENLNSIDFIDAGKHTLYVKQTVTDGAGNEQTLTTYAEYIIDPRPVTLTSASDTKEYDGEALTNDTVTATVTAEGKGFVEGQGVTITVTGTQTEVGSSDNTFTYEPKDNNTNLSNYEITPNYGTLTVTKKTTPDPVVPNPTPNTTPTPTPVVTPAPTAAPSTDDTTPENTATPAPTATAAPTATPAPAPTAAPAAARAATTIPQTGDNFPAVALVIVMLAAIVGLGITVVLRTDKKK